MTVMCHSVTLRDGGRDSSLVAALGPDPVGKDAHLVLIDVLHNAVHGRGHRIRANAGLDVPELVIEILGILAGELRVDGQYRVLGVLSVAGDAGLYPVERGAVGVLR